MHSVDALQMRAVVLSGEVSDEFATLMESGIISDEDMLGIEIKFQDSWYRFPVRDTNPFQSWPQADGIDFAIKLPLVSDVPLIYASFRQKSHATP